MPIDHFIDLLSVILLYCISTSDIKHELCLFKIHGSILGIFTILVSKRKKIILHMKVLLI